MCKTIAMDACWLDRFCCRQLDEAVEQEDYSKAQQLKQQADVSGTGCSLGNRGRHTQHAASLSRSDQGQHQQV